MLPAERVRIPIGKRLIAPIEGPGLSPGRSSARPPATSCTRETMFRDTQSAFPADPAQSHALALSVTVSPNGSLCTVTCSFAVLNPTASPFDFRRHIHARRPRRGKYRPRSILRQLPRRPDAHPQHIIAQCRDLQNCRTRANLNPIRKCARSRDAIKPDKCGLLLRIQVGGQL